MKNRNTIETILAAKEYQVKEWLTDAYEILATKDSLTEEELRKPFELDWETIARILLVRCQKPETLPKAQHFNHLRPKIRCDSCKITSSGPNSFRKRLQCPYTCKNMQLFDDEENLLEDNAEVVWEKGVVQDVFRHEFTRIVIERGSD